MKNSLLLVVMIIAISCNSTNNDRAQHSLTDSGGTDSDLAAQRSISIDPKKLDKAQLPASVKFKGDMQEAWLWTDKSGENILVTSHVAAYPDRRKEDIGDDAYAEELHAFHFVKKDSGYKLLWKISDAERSCSFDITCGFIPGATTITDINQNGIAETTVIYNLVCRSDVSPAYKKLIMHEDTIKYTLRGYMCDPGTAGKDDCVTENNVNLEKQPAPREEWEEYTRAFGRYETEREFSKAPAGFLDHARRQWLKYNKEKFQ